MPTPQQIFFWWMDSFFFGVGEQKKNVLVKLSQTPRARSHASAIPSRAQAQAPLQEPPPTEPRTALPVQGASRVPRVTERAHTV